MAETEELAQSVEALKAENNVLKRRIADLSVDLSRVRERAASGEQEIEELEERIDTLEGRNCLGDALKQFADPANWKDGNIWSPYMLTTERDPTTFADTALKNQEI